MKILYKYFFISLSAVFLLSCKYDKVPIAADSGVIRGTTYDAITGATMGQYSPLSEVKLWTFPESSTALSWESGDFYMYDIPPGEYLLFGSKDGYNTNIMPLEVYSRESSKANLILYPTVSGNNPPEIPYKPTPSDASRISDTAVTLRWRCTEPDNELIFFDVYLSQTYPPANTVAYEIPTNKYFFISGLERNTTYYWRICAKDWSRALALSDIWSFTVE